MLNRSTFPPEPSCAIGVKVITGEAVPCWREFDDQSNAGCEFGSGGQFAGRLGQSPALAGAWPRFRGPNRDGVSTQTGPPIPGRKRAAAPLGGSAGRGYASLAIADGKIFTLGDGPSTGEDKDEYVLASTKRTASNSGNRRPGRAWNSGQPNWQSSRSTPTVDGELVYVMTPHGNLICLETATGKDAGARTCKRILAARKGWVGL